MYLLSVSQGFCNALYRPTFQGRRMAACPAVLVFSFGLVSLPPVRLFIYLFIIIIIIFTVAWSITGGQKITPGVRQQQKKQTNERLPSF